MYDRSFCQPSISAMAASLAIDSRVLELGIEGSSLHTVLSIHVQGGYKRSDRQEAIACSRWIFTGVCDLDMSKVVAAPRMLRASSCLSADQAKAATQGMQVPISVTLKNPFGTITYHDLRIQRSDSRLSGRKKVHTHYVVELFQSVLLRGYLEARTRGATLKLEHEYRNHRSLYLLCELELLVCPPDQFTGGRERLRSCVSLCVLLQVYLTYHSSGALGYSVIASVRAWRPGKSRSSAETTLPQFTLALLPVFWWSSSRQPRRKPRMQPKCWPCLGSSPVPAWCSRLG